MSDAPIQWLEENARELGAALAALRARLERLAEADEAVGAVGAVGAGAQTGLGPPLPIPPALALLGRRLALSRFEQEVVLLCAAMDLDTGMPALCAAAQRDPARPFPTWALALVALDEPAWDALAAGHPLRQWRLVEPQPAGATPLTQVALRSDERIVHFLKGLNEADPRLVMLLTPLDGADGSVEAHLGRAQIEAAQAIAARWEAAAAAGGRLPLAQVTGPDAVARQLVAEQAAARWGCRLVRLGHEALPSALAEIEGLARLWERESRLLPLALLVDADDLDPGHGDRVAGLRRFLAAADGPVLLSIREPLERPGRGAFARASGRPSVEEQEAAWARGLEGVAPADIARLAGQYDFNLPLIAEAAAEVAGEPDPAARGERAWEAARARSTRRLGDLAQRVEPRAGWEDLVLPEARLALLRQVVAHVRHRGTVQGRWGFARRMNRGLGVTALFAGDSGTGKTMAAEVLAGELRLDLFRIDLSAVVNKYIGETEKNLRRLFDGAEGGGVILFFDEADALFGRRSEVKDSHDRYANLEVNYLLQRLETYRGVAILATNQRAALDDAFLRRLRFVIEFPVPDVALRRRLWEKAFPRDPAGRPTTPVDGLDFDRLARLNLAGGNIHNIALNAAFRAAADGGVVTMPLVLAATRDELEKLQRPVNPADFAWPADRRPMPVMP